jgi:hypothetical protein
MGTSKRLLSCLVAGIFTLVAPGCVVQPDSLEARALSKLRLTDALSMERSSRWRFDAGEVLHLRSANPAPDPQWEAAALAGLQYAFPRADYAGNAAPATAGLEIYLRWPVLDAADQVPAKPWIPGLPRRLARLLEPRTDAAIGVVIVEPATGRLLEHSELLLRQQLLASDADWHGLLTDAFGRYAQALSSG